MVVLKTQDNWKQWESSRKDRKNITVKIKVKVTGWSSQACQHVNIEISKTVNKRKWIKLIH